MLHDGVKPESEKPSGRLIDTVGMGRREHTGVRSQEDEVALVGPALLGEILEGAGEAAGPRDEGEPSVPQAISDKRAAERGEDDVLGRPVKKQVTTHF